MADTRYGLARMINGNELELERFVDASDTILPFYRVPLNGEHLAAWNVRALRERGWTCRRLVGRDTKAAKRSSRSNSRLLFYFTDDVSATLVSAGVERVVTFVLGVSETHDFIHFITDLMWDGEPAGQSV